ncbi:MAG: 50S ribosomal protein L5 [Bacteroidetes bacterium]|nr:50S ribosomal protein L5 [Bacteroidota bacterium]
MAKEKKAKEEKKAEKKQTAVREKGVPPRLHEKYAKEIVPAMMKQFHYSNVMQVPKLEKIAINIGIGQATQDPKLLETAIAELELITGQKAAVTKAKKAISNFKLRQGLAIGARVTLRSRLMYEFFDRLITLAMPQIRDFRGISDRSFDGRGNYTLGIKEQFIFPEIDADKITKISGMDITFVTTAKSDIEAMELLKLFGVPFVKREVVTKAS